MQYKLNESLTSNKFVNHIDGIVAPRNYTRPTVRPNPKIYGDKVIKVEYKKSPEVDNSNILPHASKKALSIIDTTSKQTNNVTVPFTNKTNNVTKITTPYNKSQASINTTIKPTLNPVINSISNDITKKRRLKLKIYRPKLLTWDEFKVFSSGSLLALGMISFGFYLGFNRPLTEAKSEPSSAQITETNAIPENTVSAISATTEDGNKVEVSQGVSPNKVDHRPPAPINPDSPKRFKIPSLKINAPVRTVGLLKDGSIAVPNYLGQVGWYDMSALPGKSGTSLMVGHYDAYDSSVVFKKLKDIQIGSEINIERGDGQIVTYIVQNKNSYDRNAVPMEQIYKNDNTNRLNIITCDGKYLNKEKTYSHRLVVYAVQK